MNILRAALSAALLLGGASAVQAATYTYDFKAAANAGGGIGESAYTAFETSSFFAGPGLTVTAGTDGVSDQEYVYFDNGNAGIGNCGAVFSGAAVNSATNGSGNLCDPGSDDGLTTAGEYLIFTAVSEMVIESIWLNSNHDSDSIWNTVWDIGGTTYSDAMGSFEDDSVSQTGDIRIDLGFTLAAGDFFAVQGTSGANSYVSALAVSQVPLPAAGWMLLAGVGGLAAVRRRRKS